jgi:hypothetical protein
LVLGFRKSSRAKPGGADEGFRLHVAYSMIGEQHGFWTGFGSINSTRVKLGS